MKQFSPAITLHGPGEWFMMWVKKPFKTLRSDYLEFNQSVKQANNIGKDKLHINRPIDSQKSKDEWCYNGNGKKQRKFSLSTHYSGSSCFENVRCSSVSCVVCDSMEVYIGLSAWKSNDLVKSRKAGLLSITILHKLSFISSNRNQSVGWLRLKAW